MANKLMIGESMNINDKNDVIKWLKIFADGSMTPEKHKVFKGMIDYLESDEVTSEPSQETIEDTLREDDNERLLYCNTCGEGTPYKDMGYVYGQYCCISCADGMGEKLTSRGCIA